MAHGRCVIYSFAGDEQEMIEKAKAGVLPLMQAQPGYLAYGVMTQEGRIISMSAWASQAEAEAADVVARQWAKDNIDATVLERFVGEYAWLDIARK
ncbi:hypothetical protein LWC35_23565 [Pseudonocardia kujensis]|uniref:antibiotic biosynthesis monooxygenase n=1 Tax=Pseudonocardia kujensis TaxID=1128675 RepID=UPI001E3C0876|nr:antibiotic biosynthesis monooxygenase [Pseudonocardia kujensis]MCE0765862.1 hypothetical protein [Pseudonocardia kujensis]